MYFSRFFSEYDSLNMPTETGPELFRKDESKTHECTRPPYQLETPQESMTRPPAGSGNRQSDVSGALGALQGAETLKASISWCGSFLPLLRTSHLMHTPFSLPWHQPFCLEAVCPQPIPNATSTALSSGYVFHLLCSL